MLLNEPAATSYDLTFNVFGFEVRTHPGFFIMPILLGGGFILPGVNTGMGWLVLIAIFWISILVHELGHALAFRYYGIHSRIVLHWMGGLAIPDGGNVWAPRRSTGLTPNQQIVVSLAGPIAGLLLAAVACVLVISLRGTIELRGELLKFPIPFLPEGQFDQDGIIRMIFLTMIVLNVVLNVFNLVPIYPMDGGQIARQIMAQLDPWNGIKNSLYLSMGACVVMILFALRMEAQFMAFFFGFMAYGNYQALQGLSGHRW